MMAAERRQPRTAPREVREALASDRAAEVAAFYRGLRANGVPAAAAQGITETYTDALLAGDDLPPEAWRL